MATIQQLERALINADKAGDSDAARKIAAVLSRARQDSSNQIPGMAVEGTAPEAPQPSMLDRAIGTGETALAAITSIPAQVAGMAGGTNELVKAIGYKLAGIQAPEPDVSGAFDRASQAVQYVPKTQQGIEQTQALGGVMENLAPLGGLGAELGALGKSMQGLKAPAQVSARAAASAAPEAIQAVKAKAITQPMEAIKAKISGVSEASPFGKGSVGAAETPQALQRRVTAEGLPVPFEGESALTRGQASRDYGQLQFEKETAKLPEVGAPLRERAAAQNARVAQNLDALIERANPASVEDLAIGKTVNQALANRFNVLKQKVKASYAKAKEAGEMAEPVSTSPIVDVLNKSVSSEANAPVIGVAKKELVRLGGAALDDEGRLIARELSINDLEELRKLVGKNSADGANAAFGPEIKRAIDGATDAASGALYRKARAEHAALKTEFENTALTNSLIENKRGTSERQVALDDVFKKVIQQSSLEELNKTRSSLLKAGPEGKQAWQDLKARTIQDIKDRAFGNTSFDQTGAPVGSPAKLAAAIKTLDREGKLEGLFGKKQAQQLRDLQEIANVIYTAPPGSINTSNTASALRIALDATATAGLTGLPVPAVTALKEAAKYVKNRETRTRVNQALNVGQKQ